MRELWATLGRVCIDDAFHRAIFPKAKFGEKFKNLDDLRAFIRKAPNNLMLGRWEIMTINRILTERVTYKQDGSVDKIVEIPDVNSDDLVLKIRDGFKGTFNFPDDLLFCSVIGLASVDKPFRILLHGASKATAGDTAALQSLLKTPAQDTPSFSVSAAEFVVLNTFLRSASNDMINRLEAFHSGRWVQGQPCEGGFTESMDEADFEYISQTRLLVLAARNPDFWTTLKEAGAII